MGGGYALGLDIGAGFSMIKLGMRTPDAAGTLELGWDDRARWHPDAPRWAELPIDFGPPAPVTPWWPRTRDWLHRVDGQRSAVAWHRHDDGTWTVDQHGVGRYLYSHPRPPPGPAGPTPPAGPVSGAPGTRPTWQGSCRCIRCARTGRRTGTPGGSRRCAVRAPRSGGG